MKYRELLVTSYLYVNILIMLLLTRYIGAGIGYTRWICALVFVFYTYSYTLWLVKNNEADSVRNFFTVQKSMLAVVLAGLTLFLVGSRRSLLLLFPIHFIFSMFLYRPDATSQKPHL